MVDENPLLHRNYISLSLSAPRVPSYGSLHRDLYAGRRNPNAILPASTSSTHTDEEQQLRLLHQSLTKTLKKNIFPYLRKDHPEPLVRWIANSIPVAWHHHLRDNGGSRAFIDALTILCTAPPLAAVYPSALYKFIRLSCSAACVPHSVGPHWRQHVELYTPEAGNPTQQRLIFFVHGGAWGSGFAWMYRLVVLPFLQLGYSVALPNYRTYPDGNVDDHIQDLELAAAAVQKRCKFEKVLLIGHSSAAHTALLLLVKRLLRGNDGKTKENDASLTFHAFLGLSGPYSIIDHFAFEASRGLEELSPMKPVCGFTRDKFRENSPCLHLLAALAKTSETNPCWSSPPITLMHGMNDSTVPFTATCDAARQLRAMGVETVEETYLPGVGHQDVPIQLMLGGVCRDYILDWVRRQTEDGPTNRVNSTSRFFVNSKL